MLSPVRLTRLLYSRKSVDYALVRTRSVLKTQPFATSASAFYASPRSRGKDKNGDDSTKGSKVKEKVISTASLVPGSQKPIANEAAQEEYAKAETAMRTPVEWFRKECIEAESRANGRITPALLNPVRVKMDDVDGTVGLEQVATVGVRDGTTLIVTVFDEQVSGRFFSNPSV